MCPNNLPLNDMMRAKTSFPRGLLLPLFALWLALLSVSFTAHAQTPQRNVMLLVGDVESRPAVLALRNLKETLQNANIAVRIVAINRMNQVDRDALLQADAVVLNILGRQLAQSLGPELQALQRAQKPVFGVGGPVIQELRELGVRDDSLIQSYYRAGGVENITNLLRHVLRQQFGLRVDVAPVRPLPESGLYDVRANRISASFDDYLRGYAAHRPGAPWIGLVFYRASLAAEQTLPLAAIAQRLEQAGYNVLPTFGYPYELPLRHFLDAADKPRVDLIVALGMKVGGTAATGALLDKIGVPAINAITLSQQSAAQWEASPIGLDIIERTWQLAGAELAGLIQPTVVASRERVTDAQSGLAYIEEQPITERVERLTTRIDHWLALRRTANADKRIALLYFNYPHGSETIGAAYLNVLPESLWQIAQRLQVAGYRTADQGTQLPADKMGLQTDIQRWGSTPGKDADQYRAGLAALAKSGQALLVPLDDYRRWYAQLPATLRASVEKAWGAPEKAQGLWRDADGKPQFVFPARRYGNLLLAPQPTRAWEQNLEKLHNDVSLPPSHAYIAFYLWLQRGYQANAVIHLGTHGTHEWLSGKQAGLSAADPTEALIGGLPNIYPYVMDDVGEGLQAKRRGMATIIDHMTPPFDVAGLNPDLRELSALLNDYRVAEQKSPLLARGHLQALNKLAASSGVLKDLGLKRIASEADLEALESYLDEMGAKLTPFGLHTFGVAPPPDLREATARAIVSLEKNLTTAEQSKRIRQLDAQLEDSASQELERLLQALDGRYIPAGPSADLIRNPAALPTGRNFYGLDPARIPSRSTYEQGARMAQQLIDDYRQRNGKPLDRMTMNLWGVETSRHEGIMEAQALALMGIRPTWDDRGRVTGVEAIPRRELGRARVDVTLVSSGLFRDLFPTLLDLLNEAARLAQRQDDADNPSPERIAQLRSRLIARGLPEQEAQQLASSRVFGLPSGAYGTNIEKLIPLSNVWQNEREVAEVLINRMSHPYGLKEESANALDADLRREVFRQALSGSKIALHSRSSNLFATLDNDDFFQYLGGTAMAIRSVDGKSPEVMVSDLSNPRRPTQTSLARYMGAELQTRYLNPRWADGMLKEGYAGARFINRVVDYLWAWQVTVPEVVDAGKWQRMYDTYVADRHGLRVRERIAQSGNLRAYQAMTDRMLTAIERGYWQPSAAVRERLQRENALAIAEAGAACGSDACSKASLRVTKTVGSSSSPEGVSATGPDVAPGQASLGETATSTGPVPKAAQTSNPAATPKANPPVSAPAGPPTQHVSGFAMQTMSDMTPAQRTVGTLALLMLAVAAFGIGYWRRSRVPG